MDALKNNLRYIDGGRLRTTDDPLQGSAVMNSTGQVLGTLTGALIDPARRHVPFLIVESRGWFTTRNYAVPVETARFDHARKAVLVDEVEELRGAATDRFPTFSDEDLVNAIFSTRAA
jgi:hypothetical protein